MSVNADGKKKCGRDEYGSHVVCNVTLWRIGRRFSAGSSRQDFLQLLAHFVVFYEVSAIGRGRSCIDYLRETNVVDYERLGMLRSLTDLGSTFKS